MKRLLLPLAIALTLAAAGCGRAPRPDDVPVVVSVIGSEVEAADPTRAPLTAPEAVLMAATAQGLVRFDGNGGIEPGLAERWNVIDEGRSYIFRLRDAQWADGSPVTAGQVVAVLRRAVAANDRNPLAPYVAVIDEIVEMTPQVIEVRLRRPRPDLLKLFAQPEMAVFRTRGRIGSGPFAIDGRHGSAVALRPVADPGEAPEEGAEDPAPEAFVHLRGEPAGLALARFVDRRSDLILGGTFVDWPLVRFTGIAPANIRIDPASGLFGLAVVAREGPLGTPALRAAVAMAIDRAAIVASVGADWTPVETILPQQLDSATAPALPAWQPLPFDERIETARAAVARWRTANPDASTTVRITLPEGPGATMLWAHLATALRRIGLEPRRVGPGEDAALRLVDRVAPYDSGRWYLGEACRGCSDEAATLIDAARDAPTLEARGYRIAEADAALTADGGFIPLAMPLRWSIVALRLGAFQGNPRAWHPLDHLRNNRN